MSSPPLANNPKRSTLAVVFFIFLAATVLWATWRVLYPFLTPILLGGIIVVLTYRFYRRLRERLRKRPTLAAILMLLGVNVVLIIPGAILVVLLVQQAAGLLDLLQKTDLRGTFDFAAMTTKFHRLFPFIDLSGFDLQKQVLAVIARLPAIVAVQGGKFLAGFANLMIGYLFMLFAMFYFYTQGERLLREMRSLSPLPEEYDLELISKFKGVIDATFRGHVLTAIAQGIATGIGLAIAGIPGAVFWGAVAVVFALVPMVGAAMVWVPAAGYLFMTAGAQGRSLMWGVFLVLWGVLIVSLIDNVIRPWAMRGGTEMSAVLLLFSVIGGIRAFGPMGLVLGPLAFALLVSVVHIYKSYFRPSLQ